jgi:hypothetical protein
LLIFNEISTNISLFDNLSDIDSNAKLDPELYKLLLVLDRQSDSNSEPSDYKLLSKAEWPLTLELSYLQILSLLLLSY